MRPFKIPESVLVVIHTADLDVLLIERADKAGFWQSVTGSKDHVDEPLMAVAAREVGEETGIVVGAPRVPERALVDWGHTIDYEIYPIWRHRYASGVERNTEHWFGLTVPRDIDITLSPLEHTDFIWLPYRDAAQRCFSRSNGEAILQLPQRLRTAA
jgi:dATP pyrophosphohydrolase